MLLNCSRMYGSAYDALAAFTHRLLARYHLTLCILYELSKAPVRSIIKAQHSAAPTTSSMQCCSPGSVP
jgi:hypothetical protein